MKKNIIIGRKQEQELLSQCLESQRAEFVAVYGRRRVGKTYLIKSFFRGKFDFYVSGVYDLPVAEQLAVFAAQLSLYFKKDFAVPNNWFDAFGLLRSELSKLRKRRWIIFIDEMPWLDTHKSNFLRALEAFWNMWGADQPKLLLIVCGSATTWMVNKLIGDKGGLHNRVTHRIHLHPFTLAETEQYLQAMGIEWDRMQVLQTYMVMGGTPFYLSLLNQNESLMQNVDRLFFGNQAVLNEEYNFLFRSLFNDAPCYKRIVELLGTSQRGFTRNEIIQTLKLSDNGKVGEVLENLCLCDFITPYYALGKKNKDAVYMLSDLYTLFFIRFVKDFHDFNNQTWSGMTDSKRSQWYGYAFEQVVFLHIKQIKQAIGIAAVTTSVSKWSYRAKETEEAGAQIDMVIRRADDFVNLCEMKYRTSPYEITQNYLQHMLNRRDLFKEKVGQGLTPHLTIITPHGLKKNKYSGHINSVVVLDDLFTPA